MWVVWLAGLIAGCVPGPQRACEQWLEAQCSCESTCKTGDEAITACEEWTGEGSTKTADEWACEAELWVVDCDYLAALSECQGV